MFAMKTNFGMIVATRELEVDLASASIKINRASFVIVIIYAFNVRSLVFFRSGGRGEMDELNPCELEVLG